MILLIFISGISCVWFQGVLLVPHVWRQSSIKDFKSWLVPLYAAVLKCKGKCHHFLLLLLHAFLLEKHKMKPNAAVS